MSASITTLTASIDNGPAVPAELTIETEQLDVTTTVETKPDPKWTYVDPAGHFHAWDKAGNLPTLNIRTRHIPCSEPEEYDDCEGYDETYYVCMICETEIEPATITVSDTWRRFAPGRKTWTVVVHTLLTASRVSVRILTESGELFGVATVVGGEVSSWDVARTTLLGAGPLGQRGRTDQ